jgi:ribosomal-protein-alanine N-acetyltransferase
MTMKRVDAQTEMPPAVPVAELNLAGDLGKQVKFNLATDEDTTQLALLRNGSEPWKGRGESLEESQASIAQLRPFTHVARVNQQMVGYVTVERDGPVAGAAYMRNIVVREDLRRRGLGSLLLDHAMEQAREMIRKTIALRVDPANAAAVNFYRARGFTTVATVVSKKSGKLRLLMSREL